VPSTPATGPTISVGVPASTAPSVSSTAELDGSPALVPQLNASRPQTPEGAFVAAGRDLSLSSAATAIQNGSGTLPSQPGVLLNPGQPSALVLSITAADSASAGPAASWDFSSMLVPALWPPTLRLDSSSDLTLPEDEAQDLVPAEWLLPQAKPADTPLELGAEAQPGLGLWQQAYDACFADGSWQVEPVAAEESASAPDAVAASAALALVLGSYWSAPQAETQRRMRQRLLR